MGPGDESPAGLWGRAPWFLLEFLISMLLLFIKKREKEAFVDVYFR
jgi:hypothetical protein